MTSTATTPNDPAESYIVKLKDHPSVDIKKHIQAFATKFNQNNQVHYKVTHEWSPSFVKAYVGTFSPHVLAELKRHGDVEYVSENSEVGDFQIVDQKDANGNDNAGWGLSRINRNQQLTGDPASVNFPYRYDGSLETGAGVDIYILDTGIKIDHEDFGGRAIWGITIDKKEGDVDDDKNGHGTHVAGIAGGTRWGVAKGATLIAVKHNGGQVEHFVKGIEWIIASAKTRQRPSVVNMSHGVPKRNRFWNETVTKLVYNDIHVVVAAGNKGWDARNTTPASAPLVNTVGSVDFNDEKAGSSNYGPCVDFFAPGVKITSCGIKSTTATAVKSGASMAAPVVTGIIATFISLHGNLPPLIMTNILRNLSLKGVLKEIPSGTTNALVRGALHNDATFSMKSLWASARLLDGSTNSEGQNVVEIFSRAILSKVDSGASIYEDYVTDFSATQIVCRSDKSDDTDDSDEDDDDDSGEDDTGDANPAATISVPLVIVSTFPNIDIALDRADYDGGKAQGEALCTLSFADKDYVNGHFDSESVQDEYNQVVFKACMLK